MTQLTKDLEDAWRDVCEVFGLNESLTCHQTQCKDIQQKLSYFSQNHSADSDYIDDVIQALSRGFYLTKSAVQWHEPAAGHHPATKINVTHKARGVQWRLVMTYGGFETVTKTLVRFTGKAGLDPTTLNDFTKKCSLPIYNPLTSPNSALVNLDKWLNKPATNIEKEALLDFLGVDKGDANMIKNWIIQSQSVSTWADAARLAKALRNATAHGALSATKVKEWGLQNALLTLSDNLGELVVAGMRKLT